MTRMGWWTTNGAEAQGIATVVLVAITAYYALQARKTVRQMEEARQSQTSEWGHRIDAAAIHPWRT
jgi:hypothetical protein